MDDMDHIINMRRRMISYLTAARMEQGVTQQQLAELLRTQRSNISRIESGGQNITLDMYLRMARALGKDATMTLSDIADTEQPDVVD